MEEKKNWISYSDRMATKKYYVLLEDKDVLGVFFTLRKACEFMTGKKFPSYWTLIRKDFSKLEFNNYSLQVIKHK